MKWQAMKLEFFYSFFPKDLAEVYVTACNSLKIIKNRIIIRLINRIIINIRHKWNKVIL